MSSATISTEFKLFPLSDLAKYTTATSTIVELHEVTSALQPSDTIATAAATPSVSGFPFVMKITAKHQVSGRTGGSAKFLSDEVKFELTPKPNRTLNKILAIGRLVKAVQQRHTYENILRKTGSVHEWKTTSGRYMKWSKHTPLSPAPSTFTQFLIKAKSEARAKEQDDLSKAHKKVKVCPTTGRITVTDHPGLSDSEAYHFPFYRWHLFTYVMKYTKDGGSTSAYQAIRFTHNLERQTDPYGRPTP